MKSRAFCGALVATSLLAASAGVEAATINVANLGDSGAGSLRQAIQDAAAGDLILVDLAGTIYLTSGALVVSKDLLIEGPGARILTITRAGSTKFRILHVTSGSLYLSGVTVTNGDASSGAQGGGAALVDLGASVTIDYSTITSNTAGNLAGGAILNNGGSVTLRFDTISANQAGVGGGIENNGQAGPAFASLLECTIADNAASTASMVTGGGGGIDNDHGTLTLDSCTIAGNSGDTGNSTSGGGGVQNVSGSTANITNTLIASNTTNQVGGDVNGAFTSNGFNLVRNRNGSTGFTTATTDQTGTAASPLNAFLGPLQNNGGHTDTRMPGANSPAIDKGRTSFHIDQRQRQAPYDDPNIPNATGGDGSDIGAVERVFSQFFFVHNKKDFGPGSLREEIIQAGPGDAVIFDSSLAGTINLTSGFLAIDRGMSIVGPGARQVTLTNPGGSAFDISGSDAVVISGLTLGNCSGLGVFDQGNVIMSDCAIVNNQGGGFLVFQSSNFLTLTRCTISGNARPEGAGIDNLGTATLTNCTIANNTATDNNSGSGRAGGIFSAGTLSLTSCTVSGNAAVGNPLGGNGGGLYLYSGTAHLANTIVAGNTTDGSGPDISGAGISDGNNLIRIGTGSSGFTNGVNHDQVGTAANPTNASLGSLRNNGGQTNTQALGAGSPAINAANSATAPATDQRNYVRPDSADIGAFEYNATIPVTLANISTRALVGTGDNVLIAGFIITGTDAKKVILRAIGPSLNLPGKIANPTLELHAGDGHSLVFNDNWIDAANKQEIIDSGVAPTNDLESAISIILQPGNYTAIMQGADNATGIGVVEAYDLDRTGSSILANISTRTFVQTGDNVLFGGFIVLGGSSQNVIVRALGPSTGVPGAMADPTLELHDGNGVTLETNDNWKQSSNKQAIIDSGIPPSNDAESAIVRTLAPGNYTVIVRGANNSTGIAVVEIYALN